MKFYENGDSKIKLFIDIITARHPKLKLLKRNGSTHTKKYKLQAVNETQFQFFLAFSLTHFIVAKNAIYEAYEALPIEQYIFVTLLI